MTEVTRRASAVRLDDLERIPMEELTWRPVRRPLGVTAFGINGYSADAGIQVIERHNELGTGAGRHEELYLVTSGRATFTVDGERIEAPAGTLVFVPDPASRREAVSEEDGTFVLVMGGKEGAALPVSPFEYWYAAQGPYHRGDYDEAIAVVSEGFADYPDHPSMHYQLACFHALAGRREPAIEHLRKAYDGDPRTREWASGDPDLESVRDAPELAG
jgi:tetratricopeptide (TPR) repeat protein